MKIIKLSTPFKILKTFIKKGKYSYWPLELQKISLFSQIRDGAQSEGGGGRGMGALVGPLPPPLVHNWPTKIYINSNNNLQFVCTNFKWLLDFIVHLP